MEFEEPLDNERMHWPLELIQHDFGNSVRSLPGLSKETKDGILMLFNLTLLYVCSTRPRKSLNRLMGEYCFRVDMRTIFRAFREPAAPEVILDAGEGLDLVREYISDPIGCLDRISRWDPKIVCPPRDGSDDWMHWAPSHLSHPGTQPADHPWT